MKSVLKKSVRNLVENAGEKIASAKVLLNSVLPKVSFDPYSPENLVVKYQKLHRSYELSKQHFWDDTKVLDELVRKYGKPSVPPDEREALLKIFSIIYYGEVVAMIVSAQLVGMVPDLDAKKVLSAQVIEEAKHVTAYQRYLGMIGKVPPPDPSTRAILDDVMRTNSVVLKITGLHLLTETVAYYLFTAIRECYHEPVLKGLLYYIARDEAKHVGFARKYLPELINKISPLHQLRVLSKQLEWTLYLVSAMLRLYEHARKLKIDVATWFDRATEDFLSVAYSIVRSTRYSKLTIPESFARMLKGAVLNLVSDR